MNNLNIKIGGPRDHARQQITFNVQYAGNRGQSLDSEKVKSMLDEFRNQLSKQALSGDDDRRVRRNIETLQEEADAEKPALKEIEGALGSIGRIVESIQTVAPALVNAFKALTAVFGFTS